MHRQQHLLGGVAEVLQLLQKATDRAARIGDAPHQTRLGDGEDSDQTQRALLRASLRAYEKLAQLVRAHDEHGRFSGRIRTAHLAAHRANP